MSKSKQNQKSKFDHASYKVVRYRLIRYRKLKNTHNVKFFFIVFIPVSLIVVIGILGQFVGRENINNWSGDNNNPESYQTEYTFQTITGVNIKLSDHQGKVVLILFITTTCPACPDEADIVADIDDYFSSSELYVIPVCLDHTVSDSELRNWLDTYNPNWPAIRDDPLYTYASDFNIMSVPTVKILDKNGNIEATMVGTDEGSYDNIKAKVNSLL